MNIEPYVKKLVNNLIKNKQKNKPTQPKQNIDLVLDGGAFNGSYLLGIMYFFREMENKELLKINRISCCSVSSFIALCYKADCLHLVCSIFYKKMRKQFNKSWNLNKFDEIFDILRIHLPDDICERFNNKVFISYYNIQKRQKVIKSTFNSVDEIFEAVRKSCFFPFIIDGNMIYKEKYIDGLTPFIFKRDPTRRILYIDLLRNKITDTLNIKGERNNYYRVLYGLLDVHLFFTKKTATSTCMCSYVDRWSFSHYGWYIGKKSMECLITYVVIFMKFLSDYYGSSGSKIFATLAFCIKVALTFLLKTVKNLFS